MNGMVLVDGYLIVDFSDLQIQLYESQLICPYGNNCFGYRKLFTNSDDDQWLIRANVEHYLSNFIGYPIDDAHVNVHVIGEFIVQHLGD
jgi:hypothetical protein